MFYYRLTHAKNSDHLLPLSCWFSLYLFWSASVVQWLGFLELDQNVMGSSPGWYKETHKSTGPAATIERKNTSW